MGHLLILLERPERALELLQSAHQRLESSQITQQLAPLQQDLEDYPAAQASYERCIELMPLMESRVEQQIFAQRSDIAHQIPKQNPKPIPAIQNHRHD
jgi:hypothetical protein